MYVTGSENKKKTNNPLKDFTFSKQLRLSLKSILKLCNLFLDRIVRQIKTPAMSRRLYPSIAEEPEDSRKVKGQDKRGTVYGREEMSFGINKYCPLPSSGQKLFRFQLFLRLFSFF